MVNTLPFTGAAYCSCLWAPPQESNEGDAVRVITLKVVFPHHQSKRYRERAHRWEWRSGMSWWCLAEMCEKSQSKQPI